MSFGENCIRKKETYPLYSPFILTGRAKGRSRAINLHLYHYAGNNPVRYTDPDGKSVFTEIKAWIKHPIVASKVGRAYDGGKNISSVATNFTINLGLSWTNFGDGRKDEGSQRGAFRHTLWQALITTKYNEKIANDIGNGHDPVTPKLENSYNNLTDADTMVDQLNNINWKKYRNG